MKNYLFFLFFILSFTLQAQQDIEGSKDHPLLTRYPGSYIASYDEVKFREYSFAYGPITGYRYIKDKKKVSGQMYRITYVIDETVENLSIGEVYQDYLQAFNKAEINIIAKGLFSDRNVKKDVGGGSWIGVALKDNRFGQKSAANFLFAGTASSGGTFSIVGDIIQPERKTYLAIYGERHSNKKVVIHVDIIEEKIAETGKVFANADYIGKSIKEKGVAVIYGIYFDFDSDQLKPTSKPTLDEIAKFLQNNKDISLYIVGHTDMKGKLGYNIELSKKRAKSVSNALIDDYGIEAFRIQTDGVGPLSPKSTNDTEEGRALNRRVELVKGNW